MGRREEKRCTLSTMTGTRGFGCMRGFHTSRCRPRRLDEQPSSACCCVGAWALKKGPCFSDPRAVSACAARAMRLPIA